MLNSSFRTAKEETMKSGYLEQLKSDIAARFEKDLRKPRAKSAVEPTTRGHGVGTTKTGSFH
jgi:hypothetical protein